MSRDSLLSVLSNDCKEVLKRELWIFGAGMTARLYINGLKRLEKDGLYIKGYIDNNPDKWGGEFDGKEIVSLNSLMDKKEDVFILICSYYSNVINQIKKQLGENGFSFAGIDEIIFGLHRDDVLMVYDMLSDEESKGIYQKLIEKRVHGDDSDLPTANSEQYFGVNRFISNNPNEVFVDCGSYVGDTIERYIWRNEGVFGKIIAFEPDPHNITAMKYRIDRLSKEWGFDIDKISIFEKGVADVNRKASVDRSDINNGFSSNLSLSDEDEGEDIVALDNVINYPISYLKADIESWEYYMLLGAEEIIKKYTPKIAVCIYHNAVDFYEIALLIKKIVPNYNISIRHHSTTLCETVLYAWVD